MSEDVRWTAEFWDERYGSQPALWSGDVNAVVAGEAADLEPGRALDVGCGEGGDSLWLAEQGWQVTGVDVSEVGLERARAAARSLGVQARTTFEQHDVLAWAPPEASYDLVSVAFFQVPAAVRVPLYAALAAAVAPGGTFLVVAHDFSDVDVVDRPHDPDLFFTADDLLAELGDGWDVVVAERRPRPSHHPEHGRGVVLHDTVLRARRTP